MWDLHCGWSPSGLNVVTRCVGPHVLYIIMRMRTFETSCRCVHRLVSHMRTFETSCRCVHRLVSPACENTCILSHVSYALAGLFLICSCSAAGFALPALVNNDIVLHMFVFGGRIRTAGLGERGYALTCLFLICLCSWFALSLSKHSVGALWFVGPFRPLEVGLQAVS